MRKFSPSSCRLSIIPSWMTTTNVNKLRDGKGTPRRPLDFMVGQCAAVDSITPHGSVRVHCLYRQKKFLTMLTEWRLLIRLPLDLRRVYGLGSTAREICVSTENIGT